MKKSNIDNRLLTVNFWRICGVNLLFFATIYMLLPLLPMALLKQAGITPGQMSEAYLLMWVTSLAMGPLNAYLCDAYRRTNVLTFALLVLLGSTFAYNYVQGYLQLLVVSAVQGASLGLAGSAGITVAIDIAPSPRRSAGNAMFGWMGRVGMLVGVGIGLWFFQHHSFRMVTYVALLAGVLAVLLTMRISLSFRAPIGVPLLSIDRFLLPRAWVPALNMALAAFSVGMLVPMLHAGDWRPVLGMALLAFVTVPVIRIFVKLSQHCQRATANNTCFVSIETGMLLGLGAAHHLLHRCSLEVQHPADLLSRVATVSAALSLLMFVAVTLPYFRRKRLR